MPAINLAVALTSPFSTPAPPCPALDFGQPDFSFLSAVACRLGLQFDPPSRSSLSVASAVRVAEAHAAGINTHPHTEPTTQNAAKSDSDSQAVFAVPEREGNDPDYDSEAYFVFVTEATWDAEEPTHRDPLDRFDKTSVHEPNVSHDWFSERRAFAEES
jgi:hypothetical protein